MICIMCGNISRELVKSQVSFWGVSGPISGTTLELVTMRLRREHNWHKLLNSSRKKSKVLAVM